MKAAAQRDALRNSKAVNELSPNFILLKKLCLRASKHGATYFVFFA
jgi:hypothetical protein